MAGLSHEKMLYRDGRLDRKSQQLGFSSPDVPNYTNPPAEAINNSQMHLILTGATGLVGSSVLDAMLKNTNISKISILSRRPVPMAEDARDSRVRVITHRDFGSYEPGLLDQLKDADGCVWALGTSQNNVNQE